MIVNPLSILGRADVDPSRPTLSYSTVSWYAHFEIYIHISVWKLRFVYLFVPIFCIWSIHDGVGINQRWGRILDITDQLLRNMGAGISEGDLIVGVIRHLNCWIPVLAQQSLHLRSLRPCKYMRFIDKILVLFWLVLKLMLFQALINAHQVFMHE